MSGTRRDLAKFPFLVRFFFFNGQKKYELLSSIFS